MPEDARKGIVLRLELLDGQGIYSNADRRRGAPPAGDADEGRFLISKNLCDFA